jgi:hypothetical protein
MANWRDTILKNFKPEISRLTLVADPDGLLTEEGMLSAIRDRSFDLISFDDPIAFRFAYESQYRSQWDKGQNTDLVVVLRSAEQQLNKLPFDLLKAGRPLTFALHQLFPKLNYPVIAGLDRAYLDAVDEAYQKQDGDQLTEPPARKRCRSSSRPWWIGKSFAPQRLSGLWCCGQPRRHARAGRDTRRGGRSDRGLEGDTSEDRWDMGPGEDRGVGRCPSAGRLAPIQAGSLVPPSHGVHLGTHLGTFRL